MSRSDLKIEDGGFPVYRAAQIPKVNAMRRARSLPDVETPIIPTRGQVLFVTAEELHNEPASCYNCVFMRNDSRCALIGPRIPIKKYTMEGIQYWPKCGLHVHGISKNPDYMASRDPDYIGLTWINAPKVGQELGGGNCGGCDGGDDCDNYIVDGAKEKWDSPTGNCRVLQTTVACGDSCAVWQDDDQLDWRQAIKAIQEQN
jgi:hypothetical protein